VTSLSSTTTLVTHYISSSLYKLKSVPSSPL
jgi:hypothetical protein